MQLFMNITFLVVLPLDCYGEILKRQFCTNNFMKNCLHNRTEKQKRIILQKLVVQLSMLPQSDVTKPLKTLLYQHTGFNQLQDYNLLPLVTC